MLIPVSSAGTDSHNKKSSPAETLTGLVMDALPASGKNCPLGSNRLFEFNQPMLISLSFHNHIIDNRARICQGKKLEKT